jgi:hypothetical protein
VNIVILNWQRLLWEGNQKVVKMSSSHEPMWVVIHMCMEAIVGMALDICLYLKLSKCYVFLIISYGFSSPKSENKRAKQVLP